ncbi:MAG: hypothetical protein AB8C46_02705 [Burkholderiaceae bacterium]
MIACSLVSAQSLARSPNEPANCLPHVSTQRVLALELPSGARRYVHDFHVKQGQRAVARRLRDDLSEVARPGRLLRHQLGSWQTFSFWLGKRFCLVQIRPLNQRQVDGLVTMTDYSAIEQTALRTAATTAPDYGFDAPAWLPRLRAQKVERWIDVGRRVTTITGLLPGSPAVARERITQAAARGGFTPSAQMVVPASGQMLIFRRAGQELAITLGALAAMTNVVVHIEEH